MVCSLASTDHGTGNPCPGIALFTSRLKMECRMARPVEVVSGFLDAAGKARGRPAGMALDGTGALLIADDVGNVIWRVR